MPNSSEKAFENGKCDGINDRFGLNNCWTTDPRSHAYSEYIRGYNEGKETVLEALPVVHIDDWLDEVHVSLSDAEAYARWWFEQRRYPATKLILYAKIIAPFKLFCTYQGARYRVSGCSRLGDIWLTKNRDQEAGYTKRVSVNHCTNWGKEWAV